MTSAGSLGPSCARSPGERRRRTHPRVRGRRAMSWSIGTLHPFAEKVELLKTIPGVDEKTAESLLAEIGTDMNRFPTHRHLASWAGMCPGNDESGGKRRSGRTRKGSKWLRDTLVQAAHAAARTKNSYLGSQYARLKGRRGAKRAAVAVGHSILVSAYHVSPSASPTKSSGRTGSSLETVMLRP